MIEEYRPDNIKGLLHDLPQKKLEMQSLQMRYEILDGVGGIEYGDKVTGSKPTDKLERVALERIELRKEITLYEQEINHVEWCITQLPEVQQAVINEFFFSGDRCSNAQYRLSLTYNISQAEVYRQRKKALRTLKKMIFG